MDNWNPYLLLVVKKGAVELPDGDIRYGNRYKWELRKHFIQEAKFLRCCRMQRLENMWGGAESFSVDEPLLASGELYVSPEGECILPLDFRASLPDNARVVLINLPPDEFEIWESTQYDYVTESLAPIDIEEIFK